MGWMYCYLRDFLMSGLEVLNSFNTLQVSNMERPFTLRKSGWLTNDSFNFVWGGIQDDNSFTPKIYVGKLNSPLIFFRSVEAGSRVTPLLIRRSGDTELVFKKWWNIPLKNPVAYYIFDNWLPPERTTAGLQLYRETPPHDLVFDSSWHLMDIKSVHSIPWDSPKIVGQDTPAFAVNVPYPVDTFAVGLSTYRQCTMPLYGASGAWLRDAVWVDGQTAKVHYVEINTDSAGWGELPYWHQNVVTTYLYVINTTRLPIPYG